MRRQIDRRTVTTGLLALMLCLGFAASGSAQGRDSNAPEAYAIQEFVTAVNTQAETIELGGETFRVSERSRLLDAAGRNIRLSELRAGTTVENADRVEFVATRARDGETRTIRRLQVVEGDFE